MHNIFITEGVVLQKRGAGEANTAAAILTREHGLLRASARSARLDKSKLRYGLEVFTVGRFSLVRGRYEWKLTGAEGHERLLPFGPSAAPRRAALGRIAKLLLRLIPGEESVPGLYELVFEGFTCLARAEDVRNADAIECVLVLRILATLGYLPDTAALAPFMKTPPAGGFFSAELAVEVERSRTLLIRTINESLSATGL